MCVIQTTGIVLHPNDWMLIDLLKTTDGAYLKSNPTISNVRNLVKLRLEERVAFRTVGRTTSGELLSVNSVLGNKKGA